MAPRPHQQTLEARDVVGVLRKVLDGGPPSKDELKDRGAPPDAFRYNNLFVAYVYAQSGSRHKALPTLLKRVREARGARLAVALMLLVPAAGPTAVAKARWDDVDLQARQWTMPHAHRIAGCPAGSRALLLSKQGMRVLEEARQLALGNDDGLPLTASRWRRYATDPGSRDSMTDSSIRSWLALPAPRRRRGTPRGLVFRRGGARRPIPVTTIQAILRRAGASHADVLDAYEAWRDSTSDSWRVAKGMAWNGKGDPLEQWGALLEPGLVGLI